ETDSMVVDAGAAWNSNPRNKLSQQIPNLEQLQFSLPSLTKEPTPIEGQPSHPATMNKPEGTESQFFLSSRTNGSKQVEKGEPVSTVTNQSKGRKSQTSPILTAPKTKQTEEGQLPLMSTTSSLRSEKSHFSSVSEMGQKGCQESQLYPFPTTGELNRIKVDQRAPISATTNEPMDKEYHVFPISATNELKWVEEDQHAPVSTGMNELEQARESLNYPIPGTSSSRGTVGKSEDACFTCQVRRKVRFLGALCILVRTLSTLPDHRHVRGALGIPDIHVTNARMFVSNACKVMDRVGPYG
ncbi:uncharacterized protein EI90DRAFT_3075982, partial [Cantharellus anzutake]|uniref:uncharacterized protein n=1 Tax=Cantharellus anzutake TaxID=1750568 RepID=UPI001905B952